jgi:hypothetical protein
VASHRSLRERLSAAYDPVLRESVPPPLALVATAANDRGRRRPDLRGAAALAASLAVGLFLGLMVRPAGGPLVERQGVLLARGGLEQALNTQLASDGGAVKLGVSFRAADGGYCRTFLSSADHLAGLACRDRDRWVGRTVSAWTPPSPTAYRTAASDTPPEVLAAMDHLIDGAPLDAAAERAARDAGWAVQRPGR